MRCMEKGQGGLPKATEQEPGQLQLEAGQLQLEAEQLQLEPEQLPSSWRSWATRRQQAVQPPLEAAVLLLPALVMPREEIQAVP